MIKPMTEDEVATRIALRALVDEYAWRTDNYDYYGYAELFSPDGEVTAFNAGEDEPFFRAKGIEEIRGVVHGNDQFTRTFHAVQNHYVTLDGGAATGVAYCTAHHLMSDGDSPQALVMLIRYHDAYEPTATGWKFASRRLELAWLEYVPAEISRYPLVREIPDPRRL
jgi:hypothetical protein